MPGGGGGSQTSKAYDGAFRNIFFTYLPAGEAPGGSPLTVAQVFFEPGEPLNTLKNNGQPPGNFFVDPEDYLTVDDKKVLKDLFRPIDGGNGGSRTNDPNKAIPLPSDEQKTSAHTFREVFNKLTTITWKFEGYADPREPSQYNENLAWARGTVAASFMMKYLWLGLPSKPVTVKNMMGNLVNGVTGRQGYSMKKWNHSHLKPLPADQKWRALTIKAIMNGFGGNSKWAGDQGRDPQDVPDHKWPGLRRVDIKVNSVIGSADHDYTTDCGMMSKKRRYYDAADWEELPSVINPDFLYDFKPNEQTKEPWDPRVPPDQKTPKGDGNALYRLRKEVIAQRQQFESGQIEERIFVDNLTKIVYGFRYLRMVQHELLRGNVPPTVGPGPGWVNPGTDTKARSTLCGTGGISGLGDVWDDMIPNDLGQFIFGGNIIDNTAGIKQARQIAHLYWVRVDPWYRAAFMKEIPASAPSDVWLDTDTVATPPEEVDLWPGADDFDDLPKNIKAELDPPDHDNPDAWTPYEEQFWENGIPKDLAENATNGGPAGYMSGKEHYRWLAENGHYNYGDLSYLSDENDIVKQSEKNRLKQAYAKKNDYDTQRSYLENLRDAIKEAMRIMEHDLTTDQWNTYIEKGRKGYPDYTSDWDTWKDPLRDPYLGGA